MNYNNTGCFDHHHHSLTTKPLSCVILCEATVCPVFRGKRRNTTHRFNTGGPSSPKIQNMRRNNNTHTLCTWNMYLPKLEWFKGQCKHMYIHLYILYIYIFQFQTLSGKHMHVHSGQLGARTGLSVCLSVSGRCTGVFFLEWWKKTTYQARA